MTCRTPSHPDGWPTVDAGTRLDLKYGLTFGSPAIAQTKLGQVVNTFVGRDVIDATSVIGQYRFIVDFKGLDLFNAAASVAAEISSQEGTEILEHQVKRVDSTGFWRLSILARAHAERPLVLRASLYVNGRQATETWSYELDAGNSLRRNE